MCRISWEEYTGAQLMCRKGFGLYEIVYVDFVLSLSGIASLAKDDAEKDRSMDGDDKQLSQTW